MKRNIWTFWAGPKHHIYNQCQISWREYAKDWKINIITPENMERYMDISTLPSTLSQLPITAQSDIIRLNLLCQHGGLWLDATILLLCKLDWLRIYCKDSYFCCKAYDAPFVENWLIAVAKPHNPSLEKWYQSLCETLEFWPSVTQAPVYAHKRYTKNDSYFMMYQCYCHLVDTEDSFIPAIVLSNSVQMAFLPIIVPFGIDPRCFIKYTSNGRRRAQTCQTVFNLLWICILIGIYIKINA